MPGPSPDSERCVLVVDDDPLTRLIIRDALHEEMRVEEACSGEEALAFLETLSPPDLVLLDVVMPGCDGFAVCTALRVRADWGSRPVVMLTALDDMASIEHAYAVGASDFIAKPIHPTLLRHRVRYLLRAHDTFVTLQGRERQLAAVQRSAQLGHWEYRLDEGRLRLSPSALRLLGLPEGDGACRAAEWLALIHVADRPRVQEVLASLRQCGEALAFEHRLARDGRILAHTLECHPGERPFWLGTVQDVTEMRRSEQRVVGLAYYDSSTGLPNRAFFIESLQQVFDADGASRDRVLVLEIDALRRVGVGWGEAVTAALLRELTARLLADLALVLPRPPLQPPHAWGEAKRPLLARLGDSAFAILLSADEVCDLDLAQRLLARLRAPLTVAGVDLVVNARVGIARAPEHGHDAETLVRRAQAAALAAVAERGDEGVIRVYDPRLDNSERHRLALEARLRRAIEREELELWYQPKIDARDGSLMGAEGLVRWRDPREGLIGPDRFIPLAEETGLIVPLTEWVLDRACADLRAFAARGWQEARLSVNISAAQLDHKRLAEEIEARLARDGVAPAALELEITEQALMPRLDSVLDTLKALHELGVAIALDDFGTGYSSLGYLGRFPLDWLKIDRSFIQSLGQGGSGEAVVRAIVALAEGLRLGVVAEGIERDHQARWLLANGCHIHQGYHYARPMEAEVFARRFTGRFEAAPWSGPTGALESFST